MIHDCFFCQMFRWFIRIGMAAYAMAAACGAAEDIVHLKTRAFGGLVATVLCALLAWKGPRVVDYSNLMWDRIWAKLEA